MVMMGAILLVMSSHKYGRSIWLHNGYKWLNTKWRQTKRYVGSQF